MEKQCEICGIFFETNYNYKKYCDSCGKNPAKAKRDMIRGYKESKKRMYDPIPQKYTCEQCGKIFQTIPKLLFRTSGNFGDHIFCSQKCKDIY